jgi:hypothetical protein
MSKIIRKVAGTRGEAWNMFFLSALRRSQPS